MSPRPADITPDDRLSAPQAGVSWPEDLQVPAAAILEGLPDAVVASDRDEKLVFVNALAEELFGYPRTELLGRPVQMLWPERERQRYTRNLRRYFATEAPLRFCTEAWGLRRDGSEFVGEMSWGIVKTDHGPLLLAIGRNVTDRREAEASQRAVAALSERALAGADAASLAAEAAELIQTRLPVLGAEVRLAGGGALARSGPVAPPGLLLPIGPGDALLIAPEGELSDEQIGVARAVANTLATALERLRGEERARYDAVHDPLTGLANRTLLYDRLEHALATSRRQKGTTAVMFVDVDDFKRVNDRHGHAAGDAVLVQLGRRLRTAVRPGDTIARFGGDEFVAVCENVNAEAAQIVGARMLEAIGQPIRAGSVALTMSASVGIALGPADPQALLDHADAAAYRAKAAGRGRVELY